MQHASLPECELVEGRLLEVLLAGVVLAVQELGELGLGVGLLLVVEDDGLVQGQGALVQCLLLGRVCAPVARHSAVLGLGLSSLWGSESSDQTKSHKAII